MTLTKVCEVCGTEFTASRTDARTCSTTCRSRGSRATEQVGVRIRAVKREVTALADVAGRLSIDEWGRAWGEVAAHMRREFARIGAQKRARS